MLRFTWKATLAVAAVTLMFAGGADAATIVIDDYTNPVSGVTVTAVAPAMGGPTTVGGATNLAAGLLTQRTFSVDKSMGALGLDARIQVAGGALNINNDVGVESSSTLGYDGGPSLDLTGLTGFTLIGTTNDGGGLGASVPGTLLLTSAGGSSLYTFSIPNGGGDVPLTFVANIGSFDPSAITSATLTFDTTNADSIDASIDRFEATTVATQVPEPTSLACLVVGIACAAGVRRFRRTPRVS